MRTIVWFIYFWLYPLIKLPLLRRGLKALDAGDWATADALADRWVPGYPVDAHRADVLTRAIAAHYEPDKYTVTPEEARELAGCPLLGTANTSVADYVWLPLTVEEGKPCIRWRDAWTLEEL